VRDQADILNFVNADSIAQLAHEELLCDDCKKVKAFDVDNSENAVYLSSLALLVVV